MEFIQVKNNKKKYLSLLLLADEQENMIDRYLERGEMFVLRDGGVKTVAVVTPESSDTVEIKNIATDPAFHGKGYGKLMIEYLCNKYKDKYAYMQVGTGDSPLTVPFYEKCGFKKSHVIKNFFADNYDEPIFECGIQLVDMIILRKDLT